MREDDALDYRAPAGAAPYRPLTSCTRFSLESPSAS